MHNDKHRGSAPRARSARPQIAPRPATSRPSLGHAARWASLAAVVLPLSGCADKRQSFLTPDGPVATLEAHYLWLITLITLIVVAPVVIGVPLLAWRYRYGNTNARYEPHWDFSAALEWPMWLVPAAIVIVLSVFVWNYTHQLDPARAIASDKPPLRIQVVGLDWKWLFIYPDYHIATVGEMAFPQNRPVSMTLTTDTVMQSFMIPALGGQIYAMPGMVTKLNLAADHLGDFEGMNTQYNGDGFHAQHFQAVAMTTQDFSRWVKDAQQDGVALDAANYKILGESSTPEQVRAHFGSPSMPKGVTFFNNAAANFFMNIVMRYHGRNAVPPAQQPGSTVYDGKMAGSAVPAAKMVSK
ncbi:MAG: cytochrome o ubiquinol oxidase subunit [Acetobacteraceae bacterium]|jgi:cytochrome o ubiquinol oxidase subunit 2|nr:cytochrome o ubiquinol oxidase subunit [Acetobacteraceae bacterium]